MKRILIFQKRFLTKNSLIIKVMKLLTVLMFVTLINVTANTFSQDKRISLALNDVSIREVLDVLENKTNIKFLYRDGTIPEKKITLKVKNASVNEILDEVLESTDIYYKMLSNNLVVIALKEFLTQQQFIVKGIVKDESGLPLAGVNIIFEGTTIGTITDAEGRYVIEVPNPDGKLIFSYLGYNTEIVVINKRNEIDVVLIPEIKALSEIVVVGYGSQKRETLTGSVSTLGGGEVIKNPNPNIATSLSGKLPGLLISERVGEPGREELDILVRGRSTLRDNSPLYIVDGVERGFFDRINPEDIESISVLKDASAAIYGARAANGVIIITTKSGKLGKPVFNFSYNTAFQQPTKVPKMLDAVEYAIVYNEGDWYRKGRPEVYTPFYTDDVIEQIRNGSNPDVYSNTNWIKEVMKPYSVQERASISVTGGTESIRYLLSFAQTHQGSAFRAMPTDYKLYNIRFKVDVALNKNLDIGANIYGMPNYRKYTFINNTTNFINLLTANPILPARYSNGLIAPGRLGENPLLLDQRGYNKYEDYPIFSSFTASYKIPFVKGLKVDLSYNFDIRNEFQKEFRLPYYYYEYNVITGEYEKKQGTGQKTIELNDTYRKWITRMFNYRITYENTFDDHHIKLMLGQEQQKNIHTWASAYRRNFVSTLIDEINVGSTAAEDKDNGGSSYVSAYNNYFGRLNYDYKGKYLVEFLFRYDGSANFPEEKRYGFFPGVSLGWRLSEESFIKNNFTFVDQLKIRGSYGEVGNDRVGAFQYLQAYSFGDNYVFGGTDVVGIYANVLPNPNITWEVGKKTDIGLELSLWKGLLGVDLTLWKEKRTNILIARNLSIANIYGFPGLPDENLGKVDNKGYELILHHKNSFGKVNYNVAGNIAFARSKIIFMDETPPAEPYQAQTGHPVGSALYYKTDGIFNTKEELDSYPHHPSTQVGDIKIIDVNGDGEINAKDMIRIDKSNIPEIVFGLNLGMRYQNLDITIFFQGQTNAVMDDNDMTYGFASLGNANFTNACVERAKNRWTKDNPNGTMPRADAFQPGSSDFFLFDATFVRLKNLEIGYTLPRNIVSKVKLEDIRIYMNGYNLLTWAKEIKWCDPETRGGYLYYPQQRIFNLGINVKF